MKSKTCLTLIMSFLFVWKHIYLFLFRGKMFLIVEMALLIMNFSTFLQGKQLMKCSKRYGYIFSIGINDLRVGSSRHFYNNF